jgi:regulator of replication initiation timing
MNSRVAVFCIVVLLAFGLYFGRRSARRENAELNARLSQVEEQLAGLKQAGLASEAEQLRAENARLRSENKDLRTSLDESKQTIPTMMDPRQRFSTQAQENSRNDPLTFYRRNPELMKRYFPQLYKAEMDKKTEEIPAPPKE